MELKQFKELKSRFEAGTLPQDEWNHAAHCAMCLWYIHTSSDLPTVIRTVKLRFSFYYVNSDKLKGLHETITVFWIRKIYEFHKSHISLSFEKRLTLLLKEKNLSDKNYLWRFYSQERIKDPMSGAIYMMPDLK
jgi:hypothetical protein